MSTEAIGPVSVQIDADIRPMMARMEAMKKDLAAVQAMAARPIKVAGPSASAYIRTTDRVRAPLNAPADRGGRVGMTAGALKGIATAPFAAATAAVQRLKSVLASVTPGGLPSVTGSAGLLTRALGRVVQATRGVGSALAMLGAGGLGGLAALAAGLGFAAKNASDLEESISKDQVVFGEGFKAIDKTIDEMVKKFGSSRNEMLGHAGQIGIALQGVGVGEKTTGSMASDMLKRAVDVESMQNVPLGRVMEKFQSGLAGGIRPLREIGVFMTAAMVKQEAYRMGLAKTGSELTEQDKVLARYSIIMRQTAINAGDAERTHGRLEGQLYEMHGRWEGLATAIGKLVVPAYLRLVTVVNRVMAGITEAIEEGKGAWAPFVNFVREAGETVVAFGGQVVAIAARIRSAVADMLPTASVTAFAAAWEFVKEAISVVAVLARNFSTVFEIAIVRAGAYLAAMGEVASAVAGGIGSRFAALGTVLADVFLGAWEVAKYAWGGIVAGFQWAGGQIASAFFAGLAGLMDGLAAVEPFFKAFANLLIEGFAKAFDVFRTLAVPVVDLMAKMGAISKETATAFKTADVRTRKLDEGGPSAAGAQADKFRELAGNATTSYQAPTLGRMPDLVGDLRKLLASPEMPAEQLAAIFGDMEEKTRKLTDKIAENEARRGEKAKEGTEDKVPKMPGAPEEEGGKKGKKGKQQASFVGVAEWARRVQQDALNKNDIPRQQLEESKKQTASLEDIKRSVKKPPVAVAG